MLVAETTSNFITVIDTLKLGVVTVDELMSCIVDLMTSLNRSVGMPDDFAPKLKGKWWWTGGGVVYLVVFSVVSSVVFSVVLLFCCSVVLLFFFF